MTVHGLARVENRDRSWKAICACGRERPARSRDEALAKIDRHIQDMAAAPCPKPRKTGYESRFDAERAIVGMWVMLRGGPPMRAYQCECLRWHLTSKPLWAKP